VSETGDRPAIDERLAGAINSSTLAATRTDERGGAIGPLEILAAAGWTSKTTSYLIGWLLIALESEWDGAEQPRAPREHDIELLAKTLPPMVDIEVVDARGIKTLKQVSRKVAAKTEVEKWYELERVRLIDKLRALKPAHAALTLWAQGEGLTRPDGLAMSLLSWWLDHRCPKCFGTKLDPLPIGGRGAVRACKACAGLGERELPYGIDGRLMERHMIDCKHRAMQKIRRFTAGLHV
jgi:hypothetical protein